MSNYFEVPVIDEQLVGTDDIIIISDTEEPGAFDRTSGVAVVEVPSDQIYRWNVLSDRLKTDHPDFSELRLYGGYATFYEHQTPDTFLESLESIADVERNAPEGPRITAEEVAELREFYTQKDYFIWPSDKVEFNLLDIVNRAALVNGEEQSEEEPEWLSVDLEEVVAEHGDFRFAAYMDDQPVQTKPMYYADFLAPVAA